MTSAVDFWSEAADRRARGAYYTPSGAAQLMTDWIVRGDGVVLEPSFGEGVFLDALAATQSATGAALTVVGAEIDKAAFTRAVDRGLIDGSSARLGDFLGTSPMPAMAAVGNPPYVRLRHLPAAQRERALAAAAKHLGQDMDPSGSVWMPFVLHACSYLQPGGRFAFVLPYDATYVRYARPLWQFLGRTFGDLLVVRVHERLFTDILQETVLLFADGKGRATTSVTYQTYETVRDLVEGTQSTSNSISLEDISRGERPFVRALLPTGLSELLDGRLDARTCRASDLITFNIGYVAGDKTFFHPDASAVRHFDLPSTSLRPTLTSTRRMTGHGVRTSALKDGAVARLFYPPGDLTPGEHRYVAHGEKSGVSQRYKCRIRQPWYVVPYVRVPDVVLSVFSERPLLLLNDAELVASNSLLCGYMKPGRRPDAFVAAWYSSLTLLQAELEVHSLGGGVFVLVPNEAGRIRVPNCAVPSQHLLSKVGNAVSAGDLAAAYQVGDAPVLMEKLGLTSSDVELVREGVARLAHWRLGAQAAASSREQVEEQVSLFERVDRPIDEGRH